MFKTFIPTSTLLLLLFSFAALKGQINQNCTGFNTISGSCASGMGSNNIVSGAHATASGYANRAQGAQSFVTGSGSRATGIQSFAQGLGSYAIGSNAIAMGRYARGTGNFSLAAGSFLQATGQGAMVIGSGVNTFSTLNNGTNNSLAVGFNSTTPALFVGPGSGATAGNVGIGKGSAQRKLDVAGATRVVTAVSESTPALEIENNGEYAAAKIKSLTTTNNTDALVIEVAKGSTRGIRLQNNEDPQNIFDVMAVNGVGNAYFYNTLNIGPGCTDIYDDQNKTYRLSVDGRLRAREVKVTSNGWCDYVFADDYDLMPLSEVEAFIAQNKHLPRIPAAVEVDAHGIELGEMQTRMMEKIEELTLYVIELNKANQALQAEVKSLQTSTK